MFHVFTGVLRYIRACNLGDALPPECFTDSTIEWECVDTCNTNLCNGAPGSKPSVTLSPAVQASVQCYVCESSQDPNCGEPFNANSNEVISVACGLVGSASGCFTQRSYIDGKCLVYFTPNLDTDAAI